jgi:cytochrome c oxidase subunit III
VSVVVLFVAVVAAITIWWLSQQRLMSKPWLEVGMIGDFAGPAPARLPSAKIGLWIFLSIVCAVLTLLISAFFMRMAPDWRPLPEPMLLWVNTGVLIFSSMALQRARVAARDGRMDGLKTSLLAGGVSALAFVAGQLLVWRQLHDGGYFLAGNPAVGFFYLLTAVHGVHLLGGVVALGRTAAKIWRGVGVEKLRLSAELCAIYWHFLLVVWVVLFGLLLLTSRFAGFAQQLANFICGVPGG